MRSFALLVLAAAHGAHDMVVLDQYLPLDHPVVLSVSTDPRSVIGTGAQKRCWRGQLQTQALAGRTVYPPGSGVGYCIAQVRDSLTAIVPATIFFFFSKKSLDFTRLTSLGQRR